MSSQIFEHIYEYNGFMKNKHLVMAILIALVSLAIMWLPFAFKISSFWGIDFAKRSMQTIVSNFDGINFLIIAKTHYNPGLIEVDFPSILSGRENLYFSAHYPGFPILVGFFDLFMSGPSALLATIVFSNVLLVWALFEFFNLFSKNHRFTVFLCAIALFFPARMLSMRIVGSNESLFIFFVLTSLIANYKQKHTTSAIMGAMAVITRSPGILLFAAYIINPIFTSVKSGKVLWKSILPYLAIPISLLSLWAFYGIIFGDFLTYFKVGGNINIYLPPFSIFGSHFDWVSGMWLEDIIYTYIFYIVGIFLFFKNWISQDDNLTVIGYFAGIYTTMILFVVHRDIARYFLPIAPIIIAGYSSFLQSKYVKYLLISMMIPIALYSWNFILNNVQPVMDWSKLL